MKYVPESTFPRIFQSVTSSVAKNILLSTSSRTDIFSTVINKIFTNDTDCESIDFSLEANKYSLINAVGSMKLRSSS